MYFSIVMNHINYKSENEYLRGICRFTYGMCAKIDQDPNIKIAGWTKGNRKSDNEDSLKPSQLNNIIASTSTPLGTANTAPSGFRTISTYRDRRFV